MNPRFLADCLAAFALCALAGIAPAAVLAARARSPLLAAIAIGTGLFTAAVLANAAADLW